MRARLLSLLQRQARPPIMLGAVVALACITAETLLALWLRGVTQVHSLGVLYLLGIVLVASIWGFIAGAATALASTIALDYFLLPPVGSLSLSMGEDWALFAVYVAIVLLAGAISRLARYLATETKARAEADLTAELGRILLRAPDLRTALPAAAGQLAECLRLPSASIELGTPPGDELHTSLPLCDGPVALGTLVVPAHLAPATLRRLRERVVPALEVVLQAAWERQKVADTLRTSRD